MKKMFLVIGRIFLSLIFVTSVANQVLTWEATHQYFVNTICDWLNQPSMPAHVQKGMNLLLAYASFAVLLAALFSGVGGLLVLFGLKVRLGATLLILFLIPTTVIMHAFWLYEGPTRDLQMIMFLKNLSMLGGL